jgi:hypothetical protein
VATADAKSGIHFFTSQESLAFYCCDVPHNLNKYSALITGCISSFTIQKGDNIRFPERHELAGKNVIYENPLG